MENQVVVFLSIFLFAWMSSFGASFPNGTEINANVVYLGSVDGKSFFAQVTPKMTWTEAKGNCTESGMQLASVTSVAQRTLLTQAYNNVTFTGYLWTSARDALSPKQFVWDLSRDALNDSVVNDYHSSSGMLTCLSTLLTTNPTIHFYAQLCTNVLGAICEINHGL